MAVQTTGYYGLGTAKRDFGMKNSMTLPVVLTPDLPSEESNKKRIEFGKKPSSNQKSWKKRLSGIFQRNKDGEIQEIPKQQQPPPTKPANDSVAVEVSVEHSEQPMDEGPIILTIKPTGATSDKKNRYVTLQPHKGESLGIYLSGGGPPITVTHVEPGGMAEKAGLTVGDTVLEVNGHDCRKSTDILRITELKMLIQQASVDSDDDDLDEEAWIHIKAKQGELEKHTTSHDIDASNTTPPDDSQATATVETEIEVPKTNEDDEPPTIETKAESPPKSKRKKKKTVSKEVAVTEQTAPSTSDKKKKKAPSVEKAELRDSPEDQPAETKAVSTNGKKKKKRTQRDSEAEAAVSPLPSTTEKESKKKKRKGTAEAVVTKTEELTETNMASPAPADELSQPKKKRKSKLVDSKTEEEAERPPTTPQVEPDEKKATKKKKKATKTTASPPPDTSEDMVDSPPPPAVQEEVPEKITIGVISKKGKKSKKARDRSELYRVKDEADVDQETSKPASTKEPKKKKKKADKKVKDTTLEKSDDLVFVSAHVETRKPPSTEVKRKGKKSTSSRRKSEDHGSLGRDEVDFAPISADQRSTSYTEDLNKEQKQFRGELRQASKSQYDMASSTPASTEEKLVMKKSGVVMRKKSGGQRPTIFGQSSSPEPEDDEGTKAVDEVLVSTTTAAGTDTAATTTTPVKSKKVSKTKDKPKKKKKEKRISTASTEMDFSDIPVTPPSLGLSHGHDKLELINRSSSMSSRRPATLHKRSSTEEEVMGTKRVDLSNGSEVTPKRKPDIRSATLPADYKKEAVKDEDEEAEGGNLILSAHKKHVLGGYAKKSGNRPSSADIAKAASQKQQKEEEKPIARSLFPEEQTQPTANLSSKSTIFEQEEPGSSPPINIQQRRLSRDKSVEKPTKTLELVGMFSQTNSMDDQSHKRIKSVDKPVKTLGIASQEKGSQPAWVAIAQGRSKRSSAAFDESPTKPQPQSLAAAPSTQPEPQKTPQAPPSWSPPSKSASTTTTTTSAVITVTEKKKPSPQQTSNQASLPRAGTVRERMAMFQQGK